MPPPSRRDRLPFRLPNLTYPLTVDTIGKVLAMGGEISATCHDLGCGRHFRINLVAIGRRRGIDYPCMAGDLLRIVYCRDCSAASRPSGNLTFTFHVAGSHSEWPRRDWRPSSVAPPPAEASSG